MSMAIPMPMPMAIPTPMPMPTWQRDNDADDANIDQVKPLWKHVASPPEGNNVHALYSLSLALQSQWGSCAD